MKKSLLFIEILLLLFLSFPESSFSALDKPDPRFEKLKGGGPVRLDLANPNSQNRVHRVGNIWMNFTNWGFFGNFSPWGGLGMDDPEYPGVWAPQAEYPANSDVQYLFQGALWLGAMVQEEGYEFPRVSTGTDGWVRPRINEFYPPEEEAGAIVERSTRPNNWNRLSEYVTHEDAVSEQDFLIVYSDTLAETFYVYDDPIDGPHFPLGIKISQKSYSWSYNYAQNFIIVDWEIENIAGNYLKNLYIGLYIDADVGWEGEPANWFNDDVCGFQKYFYYVRPDDQIDSSLINTAWIADNDGRPVAVASGNDFTSPNVTGVRVVRAPNPELRTSFNWWISNGDPDYDFGPALSNDGSAGGWTDMFGTPSGDTRKYFILSNGEFDYDQVYVGDENYIREHPFEIRDRWDPSNVLESYDWKIPGVSDDTPPERVQEVASGFDTRYLLSWGPLGIFDHIDESGNRIYRLNPGEKFSMTIAYIAGDNFHNRNNPQPDNQTIDPSRYDFTSLRYNSDWAARVYDNPMVDTPIYDWGNDHVAETIDPDGSQGDGILETGDGWYGEDVGEDGLYAKEIGEVAYIWIGGVREDRIYNGPDEGENDGHLSIQEDSYERPEEFNYTRLNGMLDFGDGYPDFQGPPPPPSPDLTLVKDPIKIRSGDQTIDFDVDFITHNLVLTWHKYTSEDTTYIDPFSREWDFEGYRIYASITGLEKDFYFMDEFDRKDWALYNLDDSLASQPNGDEFHYPLETTKDGVYLIRKKVGRNIGLEGSDDIYFDQSTNNYYYVIPDAHPMVPKYYSVTAFDYGDYKTGTPPLESAKRANMILAAPSGSDLKKISVVPNPYRGDEDYTVLHGMGLSWENRDDGTPEYFPQVDRRLYFYNLPKECIIRIYTVSGDLVDIVPHNTNGDPKVGWEADFAESWDLNSRNQQQVVSGMYLYTVEDKTEENKGDFQTGKFVIIR